MAYKELAMIREAVSITNLFLSSDHRRHSVTMSLAKYLTGALAATFLSGVALAQDTATDDKPQLDIAAVAAAGPPPSPVIATNVPAQTIIYDSAEAQQEAAAEQSEHPATKVKRAACDPQWVGKGPVPDPDTDEAFLNFADFASAANSAPTPAGYVNTFKNLKAMNNALG